MKKSTKKKINNFIAYFNRTYKYKFASVVIIVLSYICAKFSGDATALVFSLLLFGPAFFMDVKDDEEEGLN